MLTKQLLNKAADKGIINSQQVNALLAFIKEEAEGGEEQLRFVRGFGEDRKSVV